MKKQRFGGDWTATKLECLSKYLRSYSVIFHSNSSARYFTTTYVDAFAGSGYYTLSDNAVNSPLCFLDDEGEAKAYRDGSARIALGVNPPFDKYLFIEKKLGNSVELEKLRNEFPNLSQNIQIEKTDANVYLKIWCHKTDWRRNRAVVFLDPYGMQVDWSLIEAIAKTKSIDLWWLFPLGVSTIRLLTKNEMPPDEWSDALTRTFGTDSWKNVFYHQETVTTLWGEESQLCREVNFESLGKYIINRLKTVFPAVVDQPLQLCNSKNNPLYLFCFASGNPKGSKTAVKIAQAILSPKKSRRLNGSSNQN